MFAWVAVSGALFLLSTATIIAAVVLGARNQNKVNHQVCAGFNNLNRIVTATLQRQLANLPKLAYFRDHPGELAGQQAEIVAELEQFRPRSC